MTANELRETFLRYFEAKGHKVMPSSSLVPHGDPTLLLTSAGMVQFKPYFLGEVAPPATRLTSCQKCFRTTDVESVGNLKHLTFFEMLGNFSVGDYFKKEAIAYAWEFVTGRLALPTERLWVTIYLDDEEAFSHWRAIGARPERILRFGEEDNFWGPAGETGPCGPCSEIHYDMGQEVGCHRPGCAPGCDCGRFIEIWNLVFMQFYQDASGGHTPLPRQNIDTGMGLERTAAILQGRESFYDTDLFAPLMSRISELSGVPYGRDEASDRAIRVVAEHGRAVSFLVADDVVPSNDGRGYVLRRVLRRAARFGRTLGLEGPFLSQVAEVVIGQMGATYPELVRNRDLILKVIELEESRFNQTLSTGLSLLDEIMAKARSQGKAALAGQEVFRLYDTYGFPAELTREVASEQGLSVDWEGFQREMERQRERARAAQRFGPGERAATFDYTPLSLPPTQFLGYDRASTSAKVLSLVAGDAPLGEAGEGQEMEVILDRTPFYAEMGGQVADIGEIIAPQGKVAVTEAVWAGPDLIVHRGRVVEGMVCLGDEVEARVDEARRRDIARNHTATHLLQAALRRVLGEHVRQTGSLVTPDRFRFDFSHTSPLSREEVTRVQRLVNEMIRQDLVVTPRTRVYTQAVAEGAIALFGEKYGEEVRVVAVGQPPVSAELCGGTHVSRTGEIGLLYILSETGIGASLRRVEALTGRGAEAFVEEQVSTIEGIAQQLQAEPSDVQERLAAVLSDLEAERKRALRLERRLSRQEAEELLKQAQAVGNTRVLAAEIEASSMETLREVGDILRQKLGSGVVVLGAVLDGKPNFVAMVTPDLVARGLHAGKLVKEVAGVTGGSGGGRPHLGQGGGRDKDKLKEAFKLAEEVVERQLGGEHN